MPIKTNCINLIQILFLSGILLLPLQVQAQESENKAPETNSEKTESVEESEATKKENSLTPETKTETPSSDSTQTTEATTDPGETSKTQNQEVSTETPSSDSTQTTEITTDPGETSKTQNQEVSTETPSSDSTQTTEITTDPGETSKTQNQEVSTETPSSDSTQTTEITTDPGETSKTQNQEVSTETPSSDSTQTNEEAGSKEKTTLEYKPQQIKGSADQSGTDQPEKPEPKNTQVQKKETEEIDESSVVVSHRSVQNRSALHSPVPVDVIDSSDLISFGNTVDLTDQLNTLVPSYMASPAVVKNSAFVRPTSLRGMAGDQTLVLVNGKRRHRSALVQQFGPLTNRGSQGIDIAMIPTIALKNVEILRGGASAQYGSDALAGIINLNLKDSPDNASVQATYGQFYEGEKNWRVGANLGLSFLDKHGFANFSFDTNETDGHSRGKQDQRSPQYTSKNSYQGSVKQGHEETISGVGNDAIFGDSPLVNSWGRPETTSTRFMLNSALELNPSTNIYLFGNYAIADNRIRLLYRTPRDLSFTGNSSWADNLSEVRKTGFTPFLNGEQEDISTVFGIKGVILQHTVYDFSTSFGLNTLNQKLKNSLNPDAQLYYGSAQREFNLGGYQQQEQNFNADFSTSLNRKTNTNISYGLEYREEIFRQYAGSLSSYVEGGPSGMTGISEQEAGDSTRNNYSGYIDLEHTFRKSLFLQYSLRYDHFSDFGQTTNNKLAGLIRLTPHLSLRASASTNFRAPTLGQAYLRSTMKTDSMTFLETGQYNHTRSRIVNIPADSPDARHFGAIPLKEENSTDISVGLVSKMSDNIHLTLDGYSVSVKDRIYKNTIQRGTYEDSISFYTNALDLKHQGLDIVWTADLGKNISFANVLLNVAYNYNTIDVVDNKSVGGLKVLTPEQVEDMENNYPKHNFIFTANAQANKWGIMTRARYIGSHHGEAGTLGKRENREEDYNYDLRLSQSIRPVVYLDLELSYRPTKQFTFVLGGANILDKYPTKMTKPYANLTDYGMPYSRQTVANYEGGSWYLRMVYDF